MAGAGKPSRKVLLEWQDAGSRLFESTVQALAPDALRAPTALPGWTAAHIVVHVSRNADALVNLLTWARTGVETPMYADNDTRARDIDQGSKQSEIALVEDMLAAGQRYARAIADMSHLGWGATVRTAQGNLVTAETVPWMRVREVWVHAVDLGGATFAELPDPIALALLDDALIAIGKRPGAPHLVREQTDGGRIHELNVVGEEMVVRGPLAALCGYVLRGQVHPQLEAGSEGVPPAPRWL